MEIVSVDPRHRWHSYSASGTLELELFVELSLDLWLQLTRLMFLWPKHEADVTFAILRQHRSRNGNTTKLEDAGWLNSLPF